MVNTVTQTTVYGDATTKWVVRKIHIVSDGSEETDLLIYDNSAFINDVTKGCLVEYWASGNSCTMRLEWDQSTDSPIISFDPADSAGHACFETFGGFVNPAGTGATGDLFLTTANLDSGDEVTLTIKIRQK